MEPQEKQAEQLSSTAITIHNRGSGGGHSRQLFVNSWVHSQTTGSATEKPPASPSDAKEASTTPAIVLTAPEQDDCGPVVELVAPRPYNDGMRPEGMPVHSAPSSLNPEIGSRRVSICLSPTLIDSPILENLEEEEEEEKEEEEEADEGGGVRVGVGGHDSGEAGSDDLSERGSHQVLHGRMRAKSYPLGEKSSTVLPLLQLPAVKSKEGQVSTAGDDLGSGQPKAESSGLKKFAQVALLAKRWKKSSSEHPRFMGSAQNLTEVLLKRQKNRVFLEMPRALKQEMLEDAYPIIVKTHQTYKSQLGPKHKLTLLAEEHMKKLMEEMESQST